MTSSGRQASRFKRRPSLNHSNRMSSRTHAADLTSTIGKGTLFGVIANFVQLATRLITVPFAVSHLGIEGYGIWSIVMAAASYMRFGSVGAKSAFQKYAAEATGRGSFESANKLISTGTCAILVISLCALLPITLFSAPIARAVGVPGNYLRSTAGAFALLGVVMVLSNAGSTYEAIVMGGHRIDLVRKFNVLTTVLEAIAVIALLSAGKGIFSMTCVMAASEVLYVGFCFVQARRVLPQIQVKLRYVRREVWRELVRFAGTYQLRGTLELVYQTILPIAVLSSFGSRAAGLYALASKLVIAALLPQEALLHPILSSGSMVYASQVPQRMSQLVYKASKTLLLLSVPVLAIIALFGARMIFVWTGQTDASLGFPLILLSCAGLGKAVYMLGSVLYRCSGRSTLDNVVQGIRILLLLVIGAVSTHLGFRGTLAGLALVECAVIVMVLFVLQHTFAMVTVGGFISDAWRTAAATTLIVFSGWVASRLPIQTSTNARVQSALELGLILLASVTVAAPALRITGCLSTAEVARLMSIAGRQKAKCLEQT